MVHVRSFYMRCKSPMCPACVARPNGYIDQAQTRIEKGILHGTKPGAGDRVAEYIVTPFAEWNPIPAEAKREWVELAREALRPYTVEPGAWILHLGPGISDTCPQAKHFHIFIRKDPDAEGAPGKEARSMPVPPSLDRTTAPLLEYRHLVDSAGFVWGSIRELPKPELWQCLRGIRLPCHSSGSRIRTNVIGWFGRRKSHAPRSPDAEEAPERTVACPECHEEVAVASWRPVTSRFRTFDGVGHWSIPADEALFITDERVWGR